VTAVPGKIILGIPGLWPTKTDLITAIVRANKDQSNPRYLGLGPMIADLQSKESFGFEVYDRDPRLAEAFRVAGQGRLSPELLASIADHKYTVYILSQRQDIAAAKSMLRLAAFLLDAGGLAVKVETTGTAHSADRWRYYARSNGLLPLYDAYVTLVGSKDFNYTCGMHNLGLPDASLTKQIPAKDAPEYLVAFNQWNLIERPTLTDGTRFATSLSDPVFALSHQDYGYDPADEYNNPHGRWHLELTGESAGQDDDWHEGSEPMFMAFKNADSEMAACVQRARETLPWFLARFDSSYEFGTFLIKVRIKDGVEHAFFWLRLCSVKNDILIAIMFEAPPQFPNYQAGKTVEVGLHDVLDWAQIRHGTLVGGFSLRLQRSKVPQERQRHYDLYSGFIAYSPLDEILARDQMP
jgi:uncharacterized protein YegJ (DUF2314 family)